MNTILTRYVFDVVSGFLWSLGWLILVIVDKIVRWFLFYWICVCTYLYIWIFWIFFVVKSNCRWDNKMD
jgi:hypothetical protein